LKMIILGCDSSGWNTFGAWNICCLELPEALRRGGNLVVLICTLNKEI
jgi:hypothetical protein